MIRRAVAADAPALGTVHAAAWAETYPGLVPDALLAEMAAPAGRIAFWTRALSGPPWPGGLFLAEEAAEVLGFACAAPARSPALGTQGEITAIYLLRRAQRRGIGRGLLGAALSALRGAGHGSAGAWALDGNTPAERFYAATGAAAGARRIEGRGPHAVRETGWIWSDLSAWP